MPQGVWEIVRQAIEEMLKQYLVSRSKAGRATFVRKGERDQYRPGTGRAKFRNVRDRSGFGVKFNSSQGNTNYASMCRLLYCGTNAAAIVHWN